MSEWSLHNSMTLYNQIINVLENREVIITLRTMVKVAGEQQGKYIRLNPRMDILSTCIHEILHYLYPEWSEKKVLRTEIEICRSLSRLKFKRILKLMSDCIR
jgi:hypothetical protein